MALALLGAVWLPERAVGQATDADHEAEANAKAAEVPTVNFLGLRAAPLDEPIVTDRPDFTESAVTVPFGRVQLETGYTYTADDEDGVRTGDHVAPELLLRVGLVEDVELRVGWLGWSATEFLFRETNDAGRRVDVKDHEDGATDMSVGFKVHLLDQEGLVPDFGIIGELGLPIGTRTKTAGDVEPAVKLLWSYALTESLSLSGNVNFAVLQGEKGQFFQPANSVSLGYAWTDRWGTYVEYFGFYPNDRDRDCAHYVNGGVTYLLTDNLQWDVRCGAGLNEEADDVFVGTGLSFRF